MPKFFKVPPEMRTLTVGSCQSVWREMSRIKIMQHATHWRSTHWLFSTWKRTSSKTTCPVSGTGRQLAPQPSSSSRSWPPCGVSPRPVSPGPTVATQPDRRNTRRGLPHTETVSNSRKRTLTKQDTDKPALGKSHSQNKWMPDKGGSKQISK